MKYKASLDTTCKIATLLITLLVVVLPFVFTIYMGSSPIALFIAIPLFIVCCFYAPQSYIVDNNSLTVVRVVKNKKIQLSDITEIRAIAKDELGRGIRTVGVGGLFGYFGKFNYSKIGSVTFYATKGKIWF